MKIIAALLLVAACAVSRPKPVSPQTADVLLHYMHVQDHRELARDLSISDDDARDLGRRH